MRFNIPSRMAAADELVLHDLRSQTATALRTAIGNRASEVSLLDFPNHKNFGDSLIWRGTVDLLGSLGIEVLYRSDMFRCDLDKLSAQPVDVPILMHGGGNFGDLWPGYQAFREKIVQHFPQRPIVQLAQSVWFGEAAAARRCNAVMANHPDYTLLVRDEESLARAEDQLPDVRVILTPDMALSTQIRALVREPRQDMLVLARGDREAAFDMRAAALPASTTVTDWHMNTAERVLWTVTGIPGSLDYRGGSSVRHRISPLLQRSYGARANLNVRAAANILADGRVVVTDRLHAHVLCVLLGIPHVILDNTYGKISALHASYTHRFSTAFRATGVEDAVHRAEEMLTTLPGARPSGG